MNSIQRIIIGGLGGFSSGAVKFLSQDRSIIFADNGGYIERYGAPFIAGYLITYIVLILIGAIVAYVNFTEKSPLKLFFLAISAPALITTYAGGGGSFQAASAGPAQSSRFEVAIVSTAYAADEDAEKQAAPSSGGILSGIKEGIRFFFGEKKPLPATTKEAATEPATPPADHESAGKTPSEQKTGEQ